MKSAATIPLALAAIILAVVGFGCDTSDSTDDRACPGGQACGYMDHHYNSIFYCPPGFLVPGGWHGYTWRDQTNCHEECTSAANWGCDVSGCDESCDNDTGPGTWLPCNAENGGNELPDGCYLESSGVSGEFVPCACR